MKEISEVIKGYETEEQMRKLEESYSKHYNRIKILLNNDLCELVEENNLDEYTKVDNFVIPIHKLGRLFYLHRNNLTKGLHFISKYNHDTEKNSGVIIKTDHISPIDADIVLKKALLKEELKVPSSVSFSDILFIMATLIIILSLFVFGITIEEGFLSIVITSAFVVAALILIALGIILNKLEILTTKLSKIEADNKK